MSALHLQKGNRMNKLSQIHVSMLFLLLSNFGGNIPTQIQVSPNDQCITSFERFAFYGPRSEEMQEILPLSPWQHIAALPTDLRVEMSRVNSQGQQEIWLIGGEGGTSSQPVMSIFQPETQVLETFSNDVENTGFFVRHLFVTQDGAVWGEVSWTSVSHRSSLNLMPVLSRFNELTRRFELVDNVLEISVRRREIDWKKVILDHNDNFWIFAKNDAIYQYSPQDQLLTRHADLEDTIVHHVAVAPDGSLYFNRQSVSDALLDMHLFRFRPETDQIETISLPSGWSAFDGILFDRQGQLWLGSNGYRDLNGEWHFMRPYLQVPEEGVGRWGFPTLMLESTDGRHWYQLWMDSSFRAQGSAWYNPETNSGCLFTNIPSTIVEDSEHQLWIAVNENLYRSEAS